MGAPKVKPPQKPTAEPTDDELRERAARARARHGLPDETPEERRKGAERTAALLSNRDRAATEPFEAVLARVLANAPTPREETPEERAARESVERVEEWTSAQVPDAFTTCAKACRWGEPFDGVCMHCGGELVPVTCKRLGWLKGPEGRAALGGVVDEQRGTLITGPSAVAELRRRSKGPRVVILGDTRVGKSVSAAALAEDMIARGAKRVRWVNALALREPEALARALGALTAFVDDVGEEFATAGESTGLASQRCVPFVEFMGARARLRGRRLVVTTYLDLHSMAAMYGGGVAARVYEGAEVIRVARTWPPKNAGRGGPKNAGRGGA